MENLERNIANISNQSVPFVNIDQEKIAFLDDIENKNSNPPSVKIDEKLINDINSIPDKMAFKIGEAAKILGVKQYILRYWENEFESLCPKKAKNNQRVYNKKDIELAFIIKKLLYRDLYSIEGAKLVLKNVKSKIRHEKNRKQLIDKMDYLRKEIIDLQNNIEKIKKIFE